MSDSDYTQITGSLFVTRAKETCPNCGRVHVGEGVTVNGADNRRVWKGCTECWGALVKTLPDRIELQQENERLRALLRERGVDTRA